MARFFLKNCWAFLLVFAFAMSAQANVTLPGLIGDNMVLQRDVKLNLWGWADPGEKVVVSIQNKEYQAKADSKGCWETMIDPMEAGGPISITIKGNNEIIFIRNVSEPTLMAYKPKMDNKPFEDNGRNNCAPTGKFQVFSIGRTSFNSEN